MLNQFSAHEQWRDRPADERFVNLIELAKATQHTMEHSASRVWPSKGIQADVEGNRLVIKGPQGGAAVPTHWAFGQLCSRVGVPAGYMRDIGPRELVVDCINEGIARRPVEDIGGLLYQNSGPVELHAVTGPNYGRIWNANVANALVEAFGDGRTGAFRVPGEFGQQVHITKENTTLYASDRDMVVFLADEDKSINVRDRRDGKNGRLSQGIAIGNSDVGAGTLWVADFLFDYFCCNRIIWGLREVEEIRIRHTASAPHRFMSEVVPMLKTIASSQIRLTEAKIVAAQEAKVADMDKFLAGRKFNRSQIAGIKAAFQNDESRELVNECSVWDAVVAATAYARGMVYQDARVDIERAAGKMLHSV